MGNRDDETCLTREEIWQSGVESLAEVWELATDASWQTRGLANFPTWGEACCGWEPRNRGGRLTGWQAGKAGTFWLSASWPAACSVWSSIGETGHDQYEGLSEDQEEAWAELITLFRLTVCSEFGLDWEAEVAHVEVATGPPNIVAEGNSANDVWAATLVHQETGAEVWVAWLDFRAEIGNEGFGRLTA